MRKLVFGFALVLVFALTSVCFAADAGTNEIKGDYYKQYCTTLYQQGQFTVDKQNVNLNVNEKFGTLVVTGAKDDVEGAVFTIDKTFNFDAGALGRFSVEASGAKGQKVKLGFYLDNQSDPFFKTKITTQRKKKTWEYSEDLTFDVSSLGITGEHTLKIKVESVDEDDVEFSIKSFEFVEASVPVIYFDIDESKGSISAMNSSYDHSIECYGDMNIVVPSGCTSIDGETPLTGGKYELEYIRGRGNSTWGTNKLPYKLKLDSKSNLLGLGKNKHWVLIANYYDNSLLRNKITYWLGEQIGLAYTPQLEPVDVVMNGVYYGSYFLCEQVRVDKNRVEIDDLEETPDATDSETISGGYLLSGGGYGEQDTKQTFTTKHHNSFCIESPEFEEAVNETQVAYIKNYVDKIEEALYSKTFETSDGVKLEDLLDLESVSKYNWIQEFSMNGDAYGSGSTYFYKPRNGKLYFGPLWDFDYVAWGSTEYQGITVDNWSQTYALWNEKLFTNNDFSNRVFNDWTTLKNALNELTKEGGQLDKYAKAMEVTARYNFEKFGPSDLADEPITLTYSEEIERLREWIEKRAEWVDANVSKLQAVETTVTYKDENGNILSTSQEWVGRELQEIPEGPKKSGCTFLCWEYEVTQSFEDMIAEMGLTEQEYYASLIEDGMTAADATEYINNLKEYGNVFYGSTTFGATAYKNMVLTPQYIRNSDIVPIKKIDTLFDTYYGVYYEAGWSDVPNITYAIQPYDVTFWDITITSSNPNVIDYVDGEYLVSGPGDAIIYFSDRTGVKGSCKVHIYSEEEFEQKDTPYSSWVNIPSHLKMTVGDSQKLEVTSDTEGAVMYSIPDFFSSDYEVLEIDCAGNINATGVGTAIIVCSCGDGYNFCVVTVAAKAKKTIKKGTTAIIGGLKYTVTSNGTVTCNGAYYKSGKKNKKLTKITIPATVKIKGQTFKVSAIAKNAFSGCKKLKKVVIKSTTTKIGKNAFKGIHKKAHIYKNKVVLKKIK